MNTGVKCLSSVVQPAGSLEQHRGRGIPGSLLKVQDAYEAARVEQLKVSAVCKLS